MAPRKVVLAVDSSSVSLDTVRWATNVLCKKDDELHVISVLEPGLPNDVVGESPAVISTDCKPDPVALTKTQDLLRRCRQQALEAGLQDVRLTTLVSCVGGSADMGRHISDYADVEQADMLVLGSRGLGGLRRALGGMVGLGSVSDYVVKHASTNVVVHKTTPSNASKASPA